MHRLTPLLLALLSLGAALAAAPGADDALAERIGWPVTAGAAPGYVPDAACADCHGDLFESYGDVGMARSFYAPGPEHDVEDYGTPFFHAPSGNHYVTERRDDGYFQRRWKEDADGERYAEFEQRIDWVMGSGSNARTYFTRTPGGELFQLPVSWYSKPGRWAMSPGYDVPDHADFSRSVQRRCMFCHNAYPEVAEGSDLYGTPATYPRELPEGIGCQRCHGPGAEHVDLALDPDATDDAVREAIVNPARLERARRDDVCFQCHLQPLSALGNTVERVGRGEYSFVPGESLDDYQLHFDVVEDRARHERFEINHHPYRLRQSPCFVGSGGELTCVTCHDPHAKPAPEERAAFYRARCATCHATDACSADAELRASNGDDCAQCHMPKRRTEDVIQVAVTDHLVRRDPAPEDWLDAREEVADFRFLGARPYFGERDVDSDVLTLHQALFEARNTPAAGVPSLARAIAEQRPSELEPYLDLARARVRAGRPAEAAAGLASVTARFEDRAAVWLELGKALTADGRPTEARRPLRTALELAPGDPAVHFALGAALAADRPKLAVARYRAGLDLRPADAEAHEALGQLHLRAGDVAEARAAFELAVRSRADRASAVRGLAASQRLAGDWAAAITTWRRGTEVARSEADELDFRKKLAFARLAAPDAALRDAARALEHARRAVDLGPRDADARSELALAQALSGASSEALATARKARELGADAAVCEAVRAIALEALGRSSEADAARAAAKRAAGPRGSAPGLLRPRALELLER